MSDTQRAAEAAINSNITTGTTGDTTIVYKAAEVVIDEERDREEETDSLGDEVNVHDIERERRVMVETVDK